MILQDIGMLAVSSNRTKFYLLQMAKRRMLPSIVLYMENPLETTPETRSMAREKNARGVPPGPFREFDLELSVPALLETHGIPCQHLPSLDPNADCVVEAVAACKPSILIYSGPGGAILRRPILQAGKHFLHVHSGYLPDFRGSTTVYYSLLKEGSCGVTAFFLDERLDTGPVIRRRRCPPPEDYTSIDTYYDPFIRSELLVEVLQEYACKGKMPVEAQDSSKGETYFIIHPVLKHIAMLGGSR